MRGTCGRIQTDGVPRGRTAAAAAVPTAQREESSMSVPVMSSNPGSQIPDDRRGSWTPAAATAASMSDQLMMLASQVQHWHRTLLRTSTEVLALSDFDTEAIGTDAVRTRLGGLLDGAGRITWLRADTAAPGRPGGDADPVADLLLRRGSGVRVLLGGHLAWHLARSWHNSVAEVRVAGGSPPRRSEERR